MADLLIETQRMLAAGGKVEQVAHVFCRKKKLEDKTFGTVYSYILLYRRRGGRGGGRRGGEDGGIGGG